MKLDDLMGDNFEDDGATEGEPSGFRAGFAAILGKPNAGKSTLMNALVGEKIAAVSGLPQTTRDRIHGIVSREDAQIVFVDLPGLTEATDQLNEALRARVVESLSDVDVVIHLLDVTDENPVGSDMAEIVSRVPGRIPILLAVNKLDTRSGVFEIRSWLGRAVPAGMVDLDRYAEIIGISAARGANLDLLLAEVAKHLPEGPPLYDPEDLTDRDLRFLSAEIIREKVFHFTHQEIPYSTAVTIEEFKEREAGKWFISAVIHVERDSQKGMIIGKGGAMLKKISSAARRDIEHLAGTGVFLQLFVRTTKDWRRSEARLKEFGYELPKKPRGDRRR